MQVANKISALFPLPLLLAAFIVFMLPAAHALAEVTFTPSINERVTWTDSLFLKKIGAIELRSEPALSTKYRSERLELSLTGRLSDYRYLDTKTNKDSFGKINSNRYDRTTYQANSDILFQATERLKFNFGGGWHQDYSVDTFWDSELVQRTQLKRNSYNGRAGFEYQLAEKDNISVNFNYSSMKYTERTPNFSDHDMFSGSIYWQHFLIDGTMAIVAQTSWQHVNFDLPEQSFVYWYLGLIPLDENLKQDITQNVYSGMAGIYWSPIEKLTMQLMAGANHTRSEVERDYKYNYPGLVDNKDTNNDSGFTGMLDLTWREAASSIRLGVKQDFTPSAYGALRKTTTAILTHSYNISQRSQLYSTISYNRSKSDDTSVANIDRKFLRLSCQYQYRVIEDLYLRLNYAYIYMDNIAEKYKRKANTVFLHFAYSLPTTF